MSSMVLRHELPMKITFRVVPYAQMRCMTVGDWQFTKRGNLKITVASMRNKRYEDAIGYHEMEEALLCRGASVSKQAVDAWDKWCRR